MGVEFFDCPACGESVCDADYNSCNFCKTWFCTDCHRGGRRKRDCPVCSLKVITDAALLEYILKREGWDRAVVEEEYRESCRSRA